MAKKYAFRGVSAEEVKRMSIEEFIKLLSSHKRRTLKRMSAKIRKFIEKFRGDIAKGKVVKTTLREMIVLPEMIGAIIKVHSGKEWVELKIRDEMLGHRLGEFAHTTKLVKHSGPGVGATRGSKAVELR